MIEDEEEVELPTGLLSRLLRSADWLKPVINPYSAVSDHCIKSYL